MELILVIFVLFIGKLMAPITDATEALLISQISGCDIASCRRRLCFIKSVI